MKILKRAKIILALAAVCFFLLTEIKGQTNDSNAQAISILNAALQVFGGEAQLKSYDSIYVSAKGVEHRSAEVQGYDPAKESTASHEEQVTVFMDGMRLAYEYKTGRHDGTMRNRRTIYTPREVISADFAIQSASSAPVKYPSIDRTETARILPQTILLEAAANPSLVKYVGVRNYDNREHEVISYHPQASKVPILFYFDKTTHLLSKYEALIDYPTLGEVSAEYVFSDYRPHPQLKSFPYSRAIKIDGKTFRSMQYEKVLVNSPEAEEMLRVPPQLEGYIARPETVSEIAKGVFIVYRLDGYQPMFIEFKDFVLAVEAPASHPSLDDVSLEYLSRPDDLSERLISIIKRTIKDKPIRFIVPTHYHDDHAGGVRAFMKEGATILTTPGNKTFFEKMAAAKFSASSNSPAAAADLKMEIFKDKKTITDGERTVELINVGPNPHTAENIAVYLPQENYIYQGDLFYFNSEGSFPPRDRLTIMPFFAEWLKKNKLAPARIYGFHSLSFATMKHVDEILNSDRKLKKQTK